MPFVAIEPSASRPYMPDYGVVGEHEGSGLLDWSWAVEQLRTSKNLWLATRWPDGRPHVMPVWAAWDGEAIWFSAGLHARKTRNLLADGRCVLTTEDALNPLVLDGTAAKVDDVGAKQGYLDLINAKHGTDYPLDFLDPATTAVFCFRPSWAFGLLERDFGGSPTRWRFPAGGRAAGPPPWTPSVS